MKGDCRRYAVDGVFVERPSHGDNSLFAGGRVHNQLGYQGIVVRRDLDAGAGMGIYSHPRTSRRLAELNLKTPGLTVIPPLGYLDFLKLISRARLVLTDSGGIQEETTALGIPCLTLRKETERPVTVEEGTNTVVGLDGKKIRREAAKVISGKGKRGKTPELWDGKAAVRIARTLVQKLP